MIWPVVTGSAKSHAVVLAHGMRQKARHMFDFGEALAPVPSPPFDVFSFGYNWLRPIASNGAALAAWLDALRYERIDLVGYSMGGLVARVAAARGGGDERLKTIVTLATPNRGALRTSDLSVAQQAAVAGLTQHPVISPLLVKAPGVANLLHIGGLMTSERASILASGANPVSGKRYASIPALFYHPERVTTSVGPSGLMTGTTLLFGGLFRALDRPHDGIVREESANVAVGASSDWAEFDLCDDPPADDPPLCHVVLQDNLGQDHMSVLGSGTVIDLVRRMVLSDSWTELRSDPAVIHTAKITLARPL